MSKAKPSEWTPSQFKAQEGDARTLDVSLLM